MAIEEQLFDVTRELERLRWRMRRVWLALGVTWACCAGAIVVAAVLGVRQATVTLEPEGVVYDSVKARAFYVMGQDGTSVVSIGRDGSGTGKADMTLYDQAGSRACLSLTESGEPALAYWNRDATPVMMLACLEDSGTSLTMCDQAGKERLHAMVTANREPIFNVTDSHERVRLDMGLSQSEHGCLNLWRPDQKRAATFGFDVADEPQLWLCDQQGRDRIGLGGQGGQRGLKLIDAAGRIWAELAMGDETLPHLALGTPDSREGTAPIVFGFTEQGRPALQLFDQEGDLLWHAP